MPKGGARPGAGRKKGSRNRGTIEREQAIAACGITPRDYLLSVMRDSKDERLRFEAAKAAAPYCHPHLAAVQHTGKIETETDPQAVVRAIYDMLYEHRQRAK